MMQISIGMLPMDPKEMGKSHEGGGRNMRALTEARVAIADAIKLYEGEFEGQEQKFYALLKDARRALEEHAASMESKPKDKPEPDAEDANDASSHNSHEDKDY